MTAIGGQRKRQRWICHVVRIRAPDCPAVQVSGKHKLLAYRGSGIPSAAYGTRPTSVPRVCVSSQSYPLGFLTSHAVVSDAPMVRLRMLLRTVDVREKRRYWLCTGTWQKNQSKAFRAVSIVQMQGTDSRSWHMITKLEYGRRGSIRSFDGHSKP